MSFKIDPKKTGGLSDGGRKLKVGQFAYEITAAEYLANKSDPTGKEKQVVISLLAEGDYACKLYLGVNSKNEVQQEIAQKTLVSLWEASGLKGIVAPEGLKKLVGKTVAIEARETVGKGANAGKTYVNVATIEAVEFEEDEETEDEESEDESEEEETEDESEEEEEEAPAPAKGGKKKPWE
jgi:TATA-binding protein-associated factor Taf7